MNRILRTNGEVIIEGEGTIRELVERAVREGVSLEGADLAEADLRGSNLRGAELAEADLRGSNLRGADLDEADLDEAQLDCALGIVGFGPSANTGRTGYVVAHPDGPMVQLGLLWMPLDKVLPWFDSAHSTEDADAVKAMVLEAAAKLAEQEEMAASIARGLADAAAPDTSTEPML